MIHAVNAEAPWSTPYTPTTTFFLIVFLFKNVQERIADATITSATSAAILLGYLHIICMYVAGRHRTTSYDIVRCRHVVRCIRHPASRHPTLSSGVARSVYAVLVTDLVLLLIINPFIHSFVHFVKKLRCRLTIRHIQKK